MKHILSPTSMLTALCLSAACWTRAVSADEWVRQVGVTGFIFGMEGTAGVHGGC